ncbi:Exodeoxyribonuclease V beta chain [Nitrincola lacisaponensis]|uniref:RecBCD enzyme subunit RecB n=1 Tax=Nitrincola lacisaponensis TaxID=267850 RepID=A0A063Y0T2_9GAMM|nr:exodeoxyribonuclease V subunit beta [Nitrincola lacisaponensis]KDE39918.1 Exodeoxyribonuclease V beta chain [Nitrincola lacisaponensis]
MTDQINRLDPLTFPLQGQALIEASAGTGKTFTLALLYLRLVIQHGGEQAFTRPLLPPEILVVTFTNAATAELRDRIRARLVEAAQVFEGAESEDALLQALKQQLPPEQHPRAARQLTLAAQWMDESAISTIHAWCYRMLREHAFDSGSAFDPQLETHEQTWQQQAAEDYWRSEYSQLPLDELSRVVSCWASPDALLKKVKPCLDKLVYLPQPGGSALQLIHQYLHQRAQQLADLKARWQREDYIGQLQQLFDQAARQKAFQAKKLNSNHRAGVLNKLSDWLAQVSQEDPGIFSGKSWRVMSSEGVQEIWLEADQAPVDHPACRALAQLQADLAALPDLEPDLLCHAAHWIAARIEKVKLQSNSLSQNDLLLRLDQALASAQGDALARAIRKQFPVALVDEFQDTDPVQYRIFRRIYHQQGDSEAVGFFMIGDPKQAIYAFRGADIYTYLQARRDSEGRHYTLDTNYRSTAALITSVNEVFSLAEQRSRGAFLFKSDQQNPVPFVPVRAGRAELPGLLLNGQAAPALQAWWVEPVDGKLNKGDARARLAQATAARITELLTQGQQGKALLPLGDAGSWRGVQPADCAVLVSNLTEANLIRQSLQQLGVASVYLSDRSSVFQTRVASELLQLLRAVASPLNEKLIRAALASPLLRLDVRLLERLNRDELYWESQSGQFVTYHQLWQRQGILPLIYRLIQDFKLAAGATQRAQGERELTDLLHLGELLHQAADMLDGEQALIRFLEESILEPDEQSEAQQLRLETDDQLVRVVTIHKSKGLEYPLVFLPFIGDSRPATARDTLLITHTSDQQVEVHLRSNAENLAQADDERLAEDLRKLYVGLTRARFVNWIGVAETDGFASSALAYVLNAPAECPVEALQALQTLSRQALPEQLPEPWQPEQTAVQFAVRQAPRLTHEHWWIASYSALKQGRTQVSETAWQETLLDSQESDDLQTAMLPSRDLHGLPKGSHIGTFLHSLLEWAAALSWVDDQGVRQQGFAGVLQPELQDSCREYLLQRCQQHQLEDWFEPLLHWLQQFVQQVWQFPRQLNDDAEPVSLAALSSQQYSVELEFWFASHQLDTLKLDAWVQSRTLGGQARPPLAANRVNGMLKGFIDLVVEHQGRYYVLDWKSNWLGVNDQAYSEDIMRQTLLDKRYDLQYLLYLLALHRQLSVRLPGYDYDQHMGGAAYVFLRGSQSETQGVFFDKPARQVIEGLDKLFAGDVIE